jgi:glycosyltransferase involved in cell wall biosynthesis
MALVSVIIPTHNRATRIQSALASVLAQTYAALEAIVVDDGSQDGTVSVVEAYARKDVRIRLMQHKNQRGAQVARNTGIIAASGKWIAFLDSDDEWLPNSLALRLRFAEDRNLPVVHSDCYIISEGSTHLRRYGLRPLEGFVYKSLLHKPGTLFPGLLVNKDCFDQIGRLDESITSYQEWDTSIRLAKYYRFGFVSEATFVYDCRQSDSISKDLLREAKGYEQVVSKHFWSILHRLGPKALFDHYQRAAYLYSQANDPKNARRCSRNALLCWPLRPRNLWYHVERLLHLGV